MIIEALVLLLAAVISIPLWVIGSECLIVLVRGMQRNDCPNTLLPELSFKILIPAYNESKIIATTLTQLIAELPGHQPDNIVLVADNCTDTTAAIAHTLGVTVLERHDPTRRGKGYALDFGITHLKADTPPAIMVIMDADCETTEAALINLINTAALSKKPAQMTYLMRTVVNASIKQKISGFAWLLKNKIRLAAMNNLGLPVTLTGTGMAFPWEVLDTVNLGHGNLVEDMQLGIDCAINGYPPVFCPEALVYSDFPEQSSAELSQRTRWEHGHLQTIRQQVPALIKQSFVRKNGRLFALALDIGVPPLSLTVMIAVSGLCVLALPAYAGYGASAFTFLSASFIYFAVMLAGIWQRYGQTYLSANELAAIPFYIVSKLSIYLTFLFKRQKEWVRTDRNS